MEREDGVDLTRFFQLMRQQRCFVIRIISFCTIVAAIVSLLLPKQYESTTLVQTRNVGSNLSGAASVISVLGIGGGNLATPTMNYIELMKTRTVIEPIIEMLDFDDDEKPTAEKFVKRYLNITNPKESNLIEVKAVWESPEVAQRISQAVVENFLLMQTNVNKQTQSLLVQFLDNRIQESKATAESAENELLTFSKEHKIYHPDDQVKFAVDQMQAFDKAMADFEVSIKSKQASLDAASAALNEQKMGSITYNVSDNSVVQNLRAQIVSKEVELVGLQQNYTEKHPAVHRVRDEIKQLQESLRSEVIASVESNAVTLNPAQEELLKQEALASVGLSVAKASKQALADEWGKKEDEFAKLPDDVLEYIRLQRNVSIQNEVYMSLVKQSEQNKIQAAMDSMDIQVIDPANLPRVDEPVAPHKKLITLIGFVIGCFFALGYTMILYKRQQ